MKLKHQRLLYLTFFLIFFISAPLLALYTTGYRYNITAGTFQKTGILVINSLPNRADITINGKYVNRTPARFTALLPKTYQVTVSKAGYHPWTQTLPVKSSLTTFSRNIVLFRNTLPFIAVEGTINLLNATPSREKILYSVLTDTTETIWLRNPNINSDFQITELDRSAYDQLEFVSWSPNQNKALLKQTIGDFNAYLIVDTENRTVKELFDLTRLDFDTVSWDLMSDNLLYGLRPAILYQIDLLSNTTDVVLSAEITSFAVSGQDIYYITKTAQESILNHHRLSEADNSNTSEKIKLPPASRFELTTGPNDVLVLLDSEARDFFIVKANVFTEENIEQSVLLQAKAKNLAWSQDSSRVLFYTDFELWTYDFNNYELRLINRFGKTIDTAFWYPHGHYIIYQTDGSVRATETEPTVFKNDTVLVKLETIEKALSDQNGENLYFKGQIGSREGIYQLIVQ